MKIKTIITIILTAALINSFTAAAQSDVSEHEENGNPNAIKNIITESAGNVSIEIPDKIMEMILTPPAPIKKHTEKKRDNLRPGINKIRGFRVQVFADGRDQSTLETRVKMRANAISAKFPKYRGQVYTFSSSPNWYCRVGNFQTHQEATAALQELKRAFPSFAGEMRVVNSQVVIIK